MKNFFGKLNIFAKLVGAFLFGNKGTALLFWSALIFNISSWIVLALNIRPDQTGVILHYNAFLGIDAYAFDLESYYFQIFLAPLGGLLTLLINLLISAGLCFQSDAFTEQLALCGNEGSRKKISYGKILGNSFSDANLMGGMMLFWAGLIVEILILIYTLAIIAVNR